MLNICILFSYFFRVTYSNSVFQTPQIGKSLTKTHTFTNNSLVIHQQNVVNLNSEQNSTITEVIFNIYFSYFIVL